MFLLTIFIFVLSLLFTASEAPAQEIVEVGVYNTPGYALGIEVVGDYAFVADYNQGLRIINISDPENPQDAGSLALGWAYNIAVQGNYAYVASLDDGLQIVDISDPEDPDVVGNAQVFDSGTYGVDVVDNYAYLAEGTRGIRIVDITDRTDPSHVSLTETPSFARTVKVVGDVAYIADHGSGLILMDVSDPENPQELGSADTPGYAFDVFVSGDYAYVADSHNGLVIVNVSDAENPEIVHSVNTPGYAVGVTVVEDFAYVADHHGGLLILDATDPENAFTIEAFDTPGYARDVFVSGDLAYVAEDAQGVRILDCSDVTGYEEVENSITYYLFFSTYIPFFGPGPVIQITPFGEVVPEGEVFVIPDYDLANYGLGESFQLYMDGLSGTEVLIETAGIRQDVEVHLVISNLIVAGEDPIELAGIYSPDPDLQEELWLFADFQVWSDGPDSTQLNAVDEFYFESGNNMVVSFHIDEEFEAMLASLNLNYLQLGAALWEAGEEMWNHHGIVGINLELGEIPLFEVTLEHLSNIGAGQNEAFFDVLSLPMEVGWRMISMNVDPPEHDLEAIFEDLVNNSSLLFLKDHRGRFWWPEQFNFNNIGDWIVEWGYQVKMREDVDFDVLGEQVESGAPIVLRRGWSIIAYFPSGDIDVEDAFAELDDELIRVKDDRGRFYIPGVFNNMEPLTAGKGYQVLSARQVEFHWSEPQEMASVPRQYVEPAQPVHFTQPSPTAGNMSVLISSNDGYMDNRTPVELAAFTANGRCVGATVLEGGGSWGMALWSDDPTTDVVDGAVDGDKLVLKLWDGHEEIPAEIEWVKGESHYVENGLALINLNMDAMPSRFALAAPYPNPFNNSVRLAFSVEQNTEINLTIYDVAGRRVAEVISGQFEAGWHNAVWNAENLSSGMYFARLSAGSRTATVKMLLIR